MNQTSNFKRTYRGFKFNSSSSIQADIQSLAARVSAMKVKPRPIVPLNVNPSTTQELRHSIPCSSSKLDVARFPRADPLRWIIASIISLIIIKPKNQRITVALFYIDGPALIRFQWMYNNRQIAFWTNLILYLHCKFPSSQVEHHRQPIQINSNFISSRVLDTI